MPMSAGQNQQNVCAPNKDSDQPGYLPSQSRQIRRLIWVFAGCTVTLLALSCHGSFVFLLQPLYLGSNPTQSRYQMFTPSFSNSCKHVKVNEPPHDKANKMTVHPAKTQTSLGIRPVWSESSLSAWKNLGSLATHWAHIEDSDQTGCTATLLVLSCGSSNQSPWEMGQKELLWAQTVNFLIFAAFNFHIFQPLGKFATITFLQNG